MWRSLGFVGLCCLTVLTLVGCGGGKTDSRLKELNGSQIQRLVNCYTFYQSAHSYQGPKDEATFRSFLAEPRYQDAFERVGIDVNDLDSLFISERDGKPYKIKYGMKGSMVGFFEPVVFEAEGVDGQVAVGFGGSKTELMSLEESEKIYQAESGKKNVTRETAGG